jgi:hypothetical protein
MIKGKKKEEILTLLKFIKQHPEVILSKDEKPKDDVEKVLDPISNTDSAKLDKNINPVVKLNNFEKVNEDQNDLIKPVINNKKLVNSKFHLQAKAQALTPVQEKNYPRFVSTKTKVIYPTKNINIDKILKDGPFNLKY